MGAYILRRVLLMIPTILGIMAISFAVTRHTPKDAGRARAMWGFLRWALANGQDLARALSFVPLPARLIEQLDGYGRVENR